QLTQRLHRRKAYRGIGVAERLDERGDGSRGLGALGWGSAFLLRLLLCLLLCLLLRLLLHRHWLWRDLWRHGGKWHYGREEQASHGSRAPPRKTVARHPRLENREETSLEFGLPRHCDRSRRHLIGSGHRAHDAEQVLGVVRRHRPGAKHGVVARALS